jgi:hypothetical protein
MTSCSLSSPSDPKLLTLSCRRAQGGLNLRLTVDTGDAGSVLYDAGDDGDWVSAARRCLRFNGFAGLGGLGSMVVRRQEVGEGRCLARVGC